MNWCWPGPRHLGSVTPAQYLEPHSRAGIRTPTRLPRLAFTWRSLGEINVLMMRKQLCLLPIIKRLLPVQLSQKNALIQEKDILDEGRSKQPKKLFTSRKYGTVPVSSICE